MTPSGRAHPNPRTERHEGAKILRNAIRRLVRDMRKFGLRENLGWAGQRLGGWPRFPGEPDSQPSSHLSPLLLAQRVLATGNRMGPSRPRGPTVLVSRGDCAKAVIPRAKPQEACKRDLG